MNRPSLLHIIERLEGFLGKLPPAIQKPVLHELTPLKELFLQQRSPRFVLTGSNKFTLQEIVAALFRWTPPAESRDMLTELFRWQAIDLSGRGTVALLDARGSDAKTAAAIEDELKREAADIFLHLGNGGASSSVSGRELDNLAAFIATNAGGKSEAQVIGILFDEGARSARAIHNGETTSAVQRDKRTQFQNALREKPEVRQRLLDVCHISMGAIPPNQDSQQDSAHFMALLARKMPNEARVEMVRISHDRPAQLEIAQSLVKSTTAICTAIGAQPIPLADLPILTALQLVMVSGIMYIGGRERSLRAATEFVGALGVNVGAGMILREGTRALLKFFPGWGNVVCGMVAGAGTYAIGRAAIVYFLEGMSLKDARRTYLKTRKKRGERKESEPREIPSTVVKPVE
ncbi:MAG TPA: hypothetical protein VGI42_00395 [Chthoniobacterales bacterium]|jgi:uncharacterized protein (DUF697 family)